MSLDLASKSFSVANARALAVFAKAAYDEPPDFYDARTDTRGIIRDVGDAVIVASKGTSDLRNFVTDGEFWRTETLLGGIHHGFYEAEASIRAQLFEKLKPFGTKPILPIGHSLGGALAILEAKNLRDAFFNVHSVYLFGCPRPADRVYRDHYNPTAMPGSPFANLGEATFTVIHDLDVVARIPGWLAGYRRPGHDEFISAISPQDISEDPSLEYRIWSDAWALGKAWQARHSALCLDQLLADHHIDKYIAALEAIRGEDCPPDSPASDQEAAP